MSSWSTQGLTLIVDTERRRILVTDNGTVHIFNSREAAYAAFPQLRPLPVPMTPAEARTRDRQESRQRARGGWGQSRPGRRA